jgi:type IV pilus assembly protein PilE
MTDYRFMMESNACTGLRRPGRASGFTLIELMITVAIVAILVAIAISSYEFAMVKTRRGAAEGCLLETAQYMERFYTTNLTYVGADAALPKCSSDVSTYYSTFPTFAAGPDAKSYKLQLVPQGRQASKDAQCGTLTVDQAGIKGAGDNALATIAKCW